MTTMTTSYRDSSRPSIEEIPLTPTDNDSFSPSSAMRDSIITYTTDLGSSVDSMTRGADETDIGSEKRPTPLRKQSPSNFYHKRRFWAICMAITVVLAAIFIPLFFLVIIPSIAQKAINDSVLEIASMNITNPTDEGFDTEVLGSTLHAGKFDATLTFTSPLSVFYENQPVGTISSFESLQILKGQGVVKAIHQKFKITNFPLFEKFTKDSMLGTSFEWNIQGIVSIRSLGITTKNLKLNKIIKVPGAGGLSNATLNDLKVSANPDKTLHLEMQTRLYNPSPMGIEIGNMTLQVQFNGTTLASVTSNYFILANGDNFLTLSGDATFPTNDVDRINMIELIGAYITNHPVNTTSKGLYTVLKDGATAGWLNTTIQSFSLQTVVGNRPQPLQLVKGVNLGATSLVFTPETAYAPIMTSKGSFGDFVSPFDMPFEVETFQQDLTIHYNGSPVVELDTPLLSATSNDSKITFDIPGTPMKAFDDAHDLFSDFFAKLSSQPEVEVQMVGTTSVKAKTLIGEFPLNGIPFSIPFKMKGFTLFGGQGQAPPSIGKTSFKSLDAKQVVIGVEMTFANPTNGSISIGPVNLQMFYQDQQVGTVAIENLSIVPGPSPVNVQITLPNPLQNPILISYLSSNGTIVNIRGYDGSTNITSLKKLFMGLNAPTPLPPLSDTLAKGGLAALSALRSSSPQE